MRVEISTLILIQSPKTENISSSVTGAGSVYHGQIPFADLTLDTNSDTIPDCLEAVVNGSVTKFLANYSMVI